jgi:TAT (twin-arginine translocation) pathway signal sequence
MTEPALPSRPLDRRRFLKGVGAVGAGAVGAGLLAPFNAIDGATGVMTVQLKDLTGATLFQVELEPPG